MAYPSKVQPSDSGPGTYRFLVASAYLNCQENLYDKAKLHAAVEWLISLAWPHLSGAKHKEGWVKLQKGVMVDERGHELPLGSEVPKAARYSQAAFVMQVLQEEGVFASKKHEVDDSMDFFNQTLKDKEEKA